MLTCLLKFEIICSMFVILDFVCGFKLKCFVMFMISFHVRLFYPSLILKTEIWFYGLPNFLLSVMSINFKFSKYSFFFLRDLLSISLNFITAPVFVSPTFAEKSFDLCIIAFFKEMMLVC